VLDKKSERYSKKTVAFPGIYKWEPTIYIGFSPAVQCACHGELYGIESDIPEKQKWAT